MGFFLFMVTRNTATRAKVVEDWSRDGGVLLMGYEMYRLLSLKKSFVAGRKKRSKKTAGSDVIDLDEEDRQQELLKGWRDEDRQRKICEGTSFRRGDQGEKDVKK